MPEIDRLFTSYEELVGPREASPSWFDSYQSLSNHALSRFFEDWDHPIAAKEEDQQELCQHNAMLDFVDSAMFEILVRCRDDNCDIESIRRLAKSYFLKHPKVGDIVSFKHLGYKRRGYFAWTQCSLCGNARWVQQNRHTKLLHCVRCNGKHPGKRKRNE